MIGSKVKFVKNDQTITGVVRFDDFSQEYEILITSPEILEGEILSMGDPDIPELEFVIS